MLCTQIVVVFCFDIQKNFGAQHVLQMLRASEKDLPVLRSNDSCFLDLRINPDLSTLADKTQKSGRTFLLNRKVS